jgi:chromosome segregation ATPase
MSLDHILLILTTAVSLEAIYLAIFIQMTVNRHSQSLADVEEDIEDLGEEVEDLGEDIGELAEDIEEIQDDEEEDVRKDRETRESIDSIENSLQRLITELENLKQSIRK